MDSRGTARQTQHLLLTLVVVCALLAQHLAFAACPNGIRVRKEVRDLTSAEWRAYKDAVIALQTHPTTSLQYDAWTNMHMTYSREGHNTPQFFTWHRVFMLRFEDALRTINPNVTVPYWDWSYDSQNPLSSPVFDRDHYNFRVGSRGDCNWVRRYPSRHCLVRNYDVDDFNTFHDSATVNSIIRDRRTTYDRFRSLIEQAPHGNVHVSIGGDGGDMSNMMSPNDPIFWLHHSFIDKIWYERQRAVSVTDYNGVHNGRPVSLSDVLRPFGVTVRSILRVSEDLCYTYQPFSRLRASASELEIVPMPSNQKTLQPPRPVPDEWIDMCGYNKTLFREEEAYLAQVMENINRQLISTDQDPAGQLVGRKKNAAGSLQATCQSYSPVFLTSIALSILFLL